MRVSTLATFIILALLMSGCQLPYLISGAGEQIRILSKRTPIDKAIASGKLSEDEVNKLEYAKKAAKHAQSLGLNCKNNFKTYVKLKRPYVSYLVIASDKDKLKLKKWRFPLVGSFPYLGFFSKDKAVTYQNKLIKKDYDTYLRGASAYSSLGWFNEPILSSMIRGARENIAETIFHECFHGSFFAKNNVELNERLAVFIAHKALIDFLSDDKKRAALEIKSWQDQILFSEFISEIIVFSKDFYNSTKTNKKSRKELFKEIKTKYQNNLKPKLKALNYDKVFNENLNNAKLLAFKTYFHDFKNLEHLYESEFKSDIKSFITFFKELNKTKKKEKLLKLKSKKVI